MARRPRHPVPARCPVDGNPIVQDGRGRPRRYCKPACRQIAYRERQGQARRRKLVTLVEADARELLPSLPDESVDLIVTDPPYQFDRGTTLFRQDWFEMLPDSAWSEIFAELHRVLRTDAHAYVFADRRMQPIFDAVARAAGFRVHLPLVWDKGSIGPGGGAWRSRYEFICFYAKGSRPGNRRDQANLLSAPRVRGYPTEKPVAVLTTLIAQSSHRGELVLDPFCGSGNTGKAARQLNRRALLADIARDTAARRLGITRRVSSH